MTLNEKNLVQGTFAQVAPIADVAAELFYGPHANVGCCREEPGLVAPDPAGGSGYGPQARGLRREG